ncbi:MAG: hypothetical protein NT175_08540 [Bacteroidetes bacterium]|nr:hypothetical protein [Bacteroidota bacterium]
MKQIKLFFIFILPFLIIFPNTGFISLQEETSYVDKRLIKKWETPADLKTPESVCHDPVRNLIYVSNINGNPSEKDLNGFIAKLDPDGKIIELKWVEGLNAPKGMAIYKNYLYVSDIDRVVRIDLDKGTILNKFQVPGAIFLNDACIDKNGQVYISDSNSGKIFVLKEGQVQVFIDSKDLNGTNGLVIENNFLFAGASSKLFRINLNDKSIEPFIENTGGIDGLARIDDGKFLISDWKGSVYLIQSGKTAKKLLDTSSDHINAADIDYIPGAKILLVPTFYDNRVMAYEVKL